MTSKKQQRLKEALKKSNEQLDPRKIGKIADEYLRAFLEEPRPTTVESISTVETKTMVRPKQTVETKSTVEMKTTDEVSSTVEMISKQKEMVSTVESITTVKINSTVETTSTDLLAAKVPFYTYWFRYSVISHWIEDRLIPLMQHGQFLVYKRLFRLAYGIKDNSGMCDIGLTALAKSCNLTKRRAHDIIANLEQLGYIKRLETRNSGPRAKRGTRYKVLIPVKAIERLIEIERSFTTGETISTVEASSPKIVFDDDLIDNISHHHRGKTTDDDSPHLAETKNTYRQVTGNNWTDSDTKVYKENGIDQIPIEKVKSAIKAVAGRAGSRINSFNYFVREILSLAKPSEQSRSQRKKALEKIVQRVREIHVGQANYTFPDFLEDVKRACSSEGLPFDNDLFNEILGL